MVSTEPSRAAWGWSNMRETYQHHAPRCQSPVAGFALGAPMLTIAGGIILAIVLLWLAAGLIGFGLVSLQTRCAAGYVSAAICAALLLALASCVFG